MFLSGLILNVGMKKFPGVLFSFLLLLYFNVVSGQQIFINEMMSSNANAIADEDGDYSDWFELYNAGNVFVQLSGWGVSDNPGNPFKWTFPEVSLGPGNFLMVWASGKNRRPTAEERVPGIIREVYSNITGTTILSLTQHPSYPASPSLREKIRVGFEAPKNVSSNYGQRMHGFIKPPQTGSYTFWISSDDNGQLWLSTDEQPSNIRMIAEVTNWTSPREWEKYARQKSAPVFLEQDRLYYISALMKQGTGGDNLAVGWKLPDGTSDMPVSGQYLYSLGGELHTSFNLSAGGEELVLTQPGGTMADKYVPVVLTRDISYGRIPDGGNELKFFSQPTPGKPNAARGYGEILTAPQFSHSGGFYDAPFSLDIQAKEQGSTILYTLDGSVPDSLNLNGTTYSYLNQYRQKPNTGAGPLLYRTVKSQVWGGPIQITDLTSNPNQLSRISTTYDANPWYFPTTIIDKAVTVRARSVKAGALQGEVVSNTYFIRNQGLNPYHLPVISFKTAENNLFDFYKGIYVAGVDFENWRSSNPSATANGGTSANYHREGDEWEYPAHLEFFDASGTRRLAQEVGFRIHGNWSNAHPFKSLRIYARNEYGNSLLSWPFFTTRNDSAYKRIILRNSGNDIWYTMFRDAALQEIVRHLNFETQACQPSVLFINGEYWGIHNIRERYDKYYVARLYGVDPEKVDMLENKWEASEGSNTHYAAMIDFISKNGLGVESYYDWVQTQIDVSGFIDYQIAQIFIVNTDWPGNNIKFWRLQTEDFLPEAGPGRDGRWRWMMYDTDYSFGIYTPTEYSFDMMTFTTLATGTSWPNPDWSTLLFRKLLENENFRNSFIVRFCDELNTAFLPQVTQATIDRMQTAIEPEMSRHIQRWKMPSSLSQWYSNVSQMRDFAGQRPYYARNHLRQFFKLDADYLLTADVSDPNHGYVKVNTIPIRKETRGVAANPYPWNGTYFRKVALRLEAVPLPGYEFAGWTGQNFSSTDSVLELKPDGNLSVKALFRKSDHQIATKPEIIQPVNGSMVGKLIMIQWSEVTGTKTYELQVADNRDFILPFLSESGIQNTVYPVILSGNGTTCYARVRAFDNSGAGRWSDTISFQTVVTAAEDQNTVPLNAVVFPNPFSAEAFLELNLDRPCTVKIEIFTLTGNKIADVAEDYVPAGMHRIRIEGKSLPHGPVILTGRTGSGPFRIKLMHQ